MTMRSTTSYRFGDVVLVRFPFTNQQSTKKRPAVIISSAAYAGSRPDVILLAITSRVEKSSEFAYPIGDWEKAGLLKSSVFKPLIATIEQTSVLRTLGALGATDLQNRVSLLRAVLRAP